MMTNTNPEPSTTPTGPPAGGVAEDPARTLGIVSLVLVPFVQIAALIVGIIALNKSKQAGFKNPFAVWGIVLSIVFMLVGIVIAIIAVTGGFAIFGGLLEICRELGDGTHVVDGVTYRCNVPE